MGFDSDGKAKYVYVYGNTKPFELADLDVDAKVDVMMQTDPFDAISRPTSMPFRIDADNTTLIKDTYANLGITGVELKLAISDMYEVEHEVKPSLSFDPSGGTWADGGSDVRKYDAGLETDFQVVDAPTRDGYTFVCWRGSEFQPGDAYHADSDHAFVAEWKKNDTGGDDSGDADEGDTDGTDADEKSDSSDAGADGQVDDESVAARAAARASALPGTADVQGATAPTLLVLAAAGALAAAARRRRSE